MVIYITLAMAVGAAIIAFWISSISMTTVTTLPWLSNP